MVMIRAARVDEFARLTEIELDAFVVWAEACGVTSQPYASPEFILQRSFDQGLLFVAEADATGHVAGFAAGQAVGSYLYVVEIDVERPAQGQGVGRALMAAMLGKARDAGHKYAVLTTDRFAPFNAPFYAKMGFRILEKWETPPFLQERLDKQIADGLDPARRVAMHLDLRAH
ncbi:GNAT family N-acetyltransferase [Agrobacterium rosae]|uniref:GNAT family N-acetyltransferase n=1 Tax=Agrobacterium rosae TaxID=1972867 RepID=UPI000CD84976|nr:GNAT family N-acetyltransferase [Agrobacterium rosae]POO56202.1 GNAT family N-acetyltransferase [Agrobacterium rosae]